MKVLDFIITIRNIIVGKKACRKQVEVSEYWSLVVEDRLLTSQRDVICFAGDLMLIVSQ